MIPILMPKVQKKAMVESSRISAFSDIHCTPNALSTAKTNAPAKGLNPKNTPSPIPPNEACVNPPLMNTNLLVTI